MGAHLGRAVRAIATVILSAGLLSVPAAAHAATVPAYCSATGLHTFRWTGQAGDGQWANAGNWASASGGVPGPPTAPYDDYACIPAGAHVVLDTGGQGVSADLAALDLGKSAVLTVGRGGALILHGGPGNTTSLARTGSTLTVDRATLGGEATLLVQGTLNWLSSGPFAATQTTRRCDVADPPVAPCSGPPAQPGRTTIAAGGRMLVSGRGVNLEDSRLIENLGTTVLSGQGYIAADAGTKIVNGGTFTISNGKGVFEGRTHYGLPLGTFTNTGTVQKQGSGASIIGLSYNTQGAGRIAVAAGSLSVYSAANGSTTTTVASVKQGASFGTGACAPGAATCTTASPTAADTQTSKVALPALGTGSAPVSIQELPAERTAGQHMAPVRVTASGAKASSAHPLVLTFAVDSSQFPAHHDAAAIAKTIKVYRKGDSDPSYLLVPSCTGASTVACVDRSASASLTSALGGGDVVIIVRTPTPINMRWIA